MKNLREISLLSNVSANTAGAQPTVPQQHEEETFVILPVTAGGTVGLTLNIEVLNPDGVNWHQVATKTYNTAGAQAAIQLNFLPGRAIRASVTGYSAGSITVGGYAATMED